ncbi:MAG: dienelactone hydrolase family protein [Acidimicrobiales bacterium]|nr:dienelactone hydrolase family protein [Acidimicrobiales bacterium]MDP6759613.1 dienelactone hydrolase family protein [Acidimicrobiales bacterium]|tara:strand:+ start:2011 stop:2982 length:972 start_codon:yes stop_codon:yes gene_type:complete
MDDETRFRDCSITLAGVVGENVEVPSATPVNYHQAVNDPTGCEPVAVDGKLFLPSAGGPLPLVMVIPGSLGVADSHLAHAEALVAVGYAAFVLDPFGPRAVVSTVANQTQYSFAASAFDVLSALTVLSAHPAVDPVRICAQGHSRGGSAVLMAAMRRFADPVVGEGVGFAGVYSVYPWCGHQFNDPTVGATRIRAIVGDQDDWLSVQQVQAQVQAIRLGGGDVTVRVVAGAAHSFDRQEDVHEVPEAAVAPSAPTVYVDDDGSMIDPLTGRPDAGTTDLDMFLAALKAGLGRKGAHIGSVGDQPDLFRADMLAFHASVLGPPT